jgi:hypothetical protein
MPSSSLFELSLNIALLRTVRPVTLVHRLLTSTTHEQWVLLSALNLGLLAMCQTAGSAAGKKSGIGNFAIMAYTFSQAGVT